MHVPPGLSTAQFAAFLDAHEQKGLLRLLTCGSVDDGKSTLIGRMLHDSGSLADDQVAALERDSRRTMPDGGLDFSLLVDGLEAEREQGITIDVAYRYFTTDKRTFIIADCPGHEQYTRNMATGASTAELAIILIDARKGVLTQTRRHACIVGLMGIRHVVLAVNKMDLVEWDQARFDAIVAEFQGFAGQLGIQAVTAIPLSALTGDNVVTPSAAMAWYGGPTLLGHLETAEAAIAGGEGPFRLPVQWVARPHQDYRGYAGSLAAGRVAVGQQVSVEPGGRLSRIQSILVGDRPVDEALPGQAVMVSLEDEVDVSRGDVIAAADGRPEASDQFSAHVVWMDSHPLLPGRPYLLRLGTKTVSVQVTDIRHRVNVNTLDHVAAKKLELNDVALCHLATDQPVVFQPYAESRDLGGFLIIDKLTNATVGCGMIQFALRRASNIHWQEMTVDKAARARIKAQQPCVLWLTGLSGSGKSTVANLVEKQLLAMGHHTYLLDGDNVRHGLSRDLGFTDEDRVENIRRVAELSKLFVDAGLIVLVSFISPFAAERQMARDLVAEGEFIEVFVDAPLQVCEERDPKGLYRKARRGGIQHFTGLDSAYEAPEAPELHLRSDQETAEALAARVLEELQRRGFIQAS